jgi:membrane-associated phospholipid phosphatase
MFAWLLGAASYLAALLGSSLLGVWPSWPSLALPGCACLMLGALALYYQRWRNEAKICRALACIAWIVSFTLAGGYLTYLAAALGMPLQDARFAQWDAALGFDWLALMHVIDSKPIAAAVLDAAYASSRFQILAIFLALGLARADDRLWEFLVLYAMTALATVLISALTPALGAYHFHIPARDASLGAISATSGVWHMSDVTGLRDGSLTIIDLTRIEGVVTFPSFHTALAVICIWSTRRIAYLHLPMVLLNLVVIVSTLPIGGHYLVDVIAGAMIAAGAILLDRRMFLRRHIADPVRYEHPAAVPVMRSETYRNKSPSPL